jgi:hypothetical protein
MTACSGFQAISWGTVFSANQECERIIRLNSTVCGTGIESFANLGEEESNGVVVEYQTVLRNVGVLIHLDLGQCRSCVISHCQFIDSSAHRARIRSGRNDTGNNWTAVRCDFKDDQNNGETFSGLGNAASFYVYDCRFSLGAPNYTGIATLVGFVNASFIAYCTSWNVYNTCPLYNIKLQTQTFAFTPSMRLSGSRFFERSRPLFHSIQFPVTKNLPASLALMVTGSFAASESLTHSRLFSTKVFRRSSELLPHSSDPKAESGGKAGPPLGIIVGVVVGAVVLAAVAAVAAFLWRRSGSSPSSASGSSREELVFAQTLDFETRDLTTMSGATCETVATVIPASMEGGFVPDSFMML